MKKQLPGFLVGMLTMAIIGSLSVGALAATGQLTITVDPVNIQVNGQTFQPTNANGEAVPVFAYNGTTYAPLRALAEAYGLDVGYDAANNMATVSSDTKAADTPSPDTTAPTNDYSDWSAEEEAAYQEFKGMWTVNTSTRNDVATANHPISKYEVQQLFKSDSAKLFAVRFAIESLSNDVITSGYIWFGYHGGIETETYAVYVSGTSPDDCLVTFVQD